VAFSTYFQPSAAIGGDYYDILPLDGGREPARRLAVVIADVAGHGLSAGLGMAMLKAALLILVEEGREPQSILTALDRLVRSTPQKTFVTATLARVDLDRGRLEITNAGHPPTYLLRRGEVREIALPSTPLGVLDSSYRTEALDLEPGDMLVWLSDGFIEATSTEGECFGYERTREALCGDADTPADLRDRFLDAVRTHSEAQAAADDCTLVVMHYRPSEAGGAALRAVGT
jgi:serine phosphatase RsbU (regulator of sigma subunit)